MFDLSSINQRYFGMKFKITVDKIVDEKVTKVEKEIILEIEPPKKKILNKIVKLRSGKDEDTMDDLYEAVGMVLNKNKAGKKITDEIIAELNYDQIDAILTAYFEWLAKEKNSPN